MALTQTPASQTGRMVAALLWTALGALVLWGFLVQQDGLALAIGGLTLFVAAIVATFARRYMRADARQGRFFLRLAALAGAVLAFVFTGNLMALALAWCASGWLLAALVGHCTGWDEAFAAARRTRMTFIGGDAALLAALALLGWQAGSARIDAVLEAAPQMPPLLVALAALLLVVAAAVRCALPPFAGWLLSSMTAPTPVSALMHAGLVNAGGFLLIRFAPVLEAAPAARAVAVVVGLAAAIYGIGVMLVRPDVKRALAASTVSQMGFMIMSCGLGAYAAALWHIVAHGLFKAWLFLGSGSAIGMKQAGAAAPLSGGATLAIAAGTLGVALSVISFGEGQASLIPLLLGLATAMATLLACLGGRLPLRARLALAGLVAALIAFHAAGLATAARATGPDAGALVPEWGLVGLLVAFLGAWTWQQRRLAGGRSLPLPLYVHLINAGALPPVTKGEAK
jgi:NAD(P)H-quinone oxidoreductase subunit 5